MDIPWFLQGYQMRGGGGFNLSNYSVSPGNTISPRRHDGKPSMSANQKQMPGNRVLSAVLRSQLSAASLGERARVSEEAGELERERCIRKKISQQVR